MGRKMDNKTIEITKYFRSAVASQSSMGIDFKVDYFSAVEIEEVIQGRINPVACDAIFLEAKKNTSDDENETKKKTLVNVIICAKTIKTIFETNDKTQTSIEELTGIYYIPALLDEEGSLLFDEGEKKLPWFPREYLMPMVEPTLAVGNADVVDSFMSDNVGCIETIQSWTRYAKFFKELYQTVTESPFEQNRVRNMDEKDASFELENKVYLFLDKTVYSTFHIMNLYNHLLEDKLSNELYERFMSTQIQAVSPLIENDLSKMKLHCAQMNGEYPLSPSQREAVNHFNVMTHGEILAVNGPPGTGKTTLLQTIVADMYVKRAIKKEKAPLIVASSTNNQAVTNIIASFGNIKNMGISNLEARWIEGVSSFAAYFPSSAKAKEAQNKGYQYTDQRGSFFVADIEDKNNIEKSKAKLIEACNKYFGSRCKSVAACQDKLHEELLFIEENKLLLLSLAQEVLHYDLKNEAVDQCIDQLGLLIKEENGKLASIDARVKEWERCYEQIPFYVRWFQFIKAFEKKIQTVFRLFMNNEEQHFLNEYMSIDDIKEQYSYLHTEANKALDDLETKKGALEEIKTRYDSALDQLKQHNVDLHEKKDEKYNLNLEYVNGLMDKKHRYVEFWLAVHYYECRWLNGEDELSEKQKGTNFINVLKKFYHRLSMVTPCLVMTFYMLPRQFLGFAEHKPRFLYDYIDLLIVDESGQVSPEVAAGAFALARKAVVVGDVYQIEPVWSVNKALDKALALSSGAIQSLDEFALLEQTGLNSSQSSVMKVAAKCCKYEKFYERGLFLSEHRRCYDEIIEYCNALVYKGNLEPMRGMGKYDEHLAVKQWPQMGFKQIDTEYSKRKGSSRENQVEAEVIVEWLIKHFEPIAEAYPEEKRENLIGIITPFKAQVDCVKVELKKRLPTHCSNISVGTVHTFQGAERKIIILSTVYGKHDGCFFIDANKSLMNVAVSRAKDNFFVFGDINCLKDNRSSASGLLKECICKYSVENII